MSAKRHIKIHTKIALPLPHPSLILQGKLRVNFSSLSLVSLSLVSNTVQRLTIYSKIIHFFTKHWDNSLKTLTIGSFGSKKVILNIKDDPVLQASIQVFKVPPQRTSHSWQTSNKDMITKCSRYLPWVKWYHQWHNGWNCPPSLQSGAWNGLQVHQKRTPILDKLLVKIWTQNFQDNFLKVNEISNNITDDPVFPVSSPEPSISSQYPNKGVPILVNHWHPRWPSPASNPLEPWIWPCPPSLQSGTLNVLQVPPLRTTHSYHTSFKDMNIQISGYLS